MKFGLLTSILFGAFVLFAGLAAGGEQEAKQVAAPAIDERVQRLLRQVDRKLPYYSKDYYYTPPEEECDCGCYDAYDYGGGSKKSRRERELMMGGKKSGGGKKSKKSYSYEYDGGCDCGGSANGNYGSKKSRELRERELMMGGKKSKKSYTYEYDPCGGGDYYGGSKKSKKSS